MNAPRHFPTLVFDRDAPALPIFANVAYASHAFQSPQLEQRIAFFKGTNFSQPTDNAELKIFETAFSHQFPRIWFALRDNYGTHSRSDSMDNWKIYGNAWKSYREEAPLSVPANRAIAATAAVLLSISPSNLQVFRTICEKSANCVEEEVQT